MAAMLLSLMPIVAFAAPTGTAISTLDELKAMKNNGTYYLANDITITGEWNFLPGSTSTPYRWENATLDGNGHTIYYADGCDIECFLYGKNSELSTVAVDYSYFLSSDLFVDHYLISFCADK